MSHLFCTSSVVGFTTILKLITLNRRGHNKTYNFLHDRYFSDHRSQMKHYKVS